MCPVKSGSPRLLPCCLRENWCHISCRCQTHWGRICPCHVKILDPRRKITVMSHPYFEDHVVLPTRSTIRMDNRNVERDRGFKVPNEEATTSRWSAPTWVNVFLERHAWISSRLSVEARSIRHGAKGAYDDSRNDALESRPTINLFELWIC